IGHSSDRGFLWAEMRVEIRAKNQGQAVRFYSSEGVHETMRLAVPNDRAAEHPSFAQRRSSIQVRDGHAQPGNSLVVGDSRDYRHTPPHSERQFHGLELIEWQAAQYGVSSIFGGRSRVMAIPHRWRVVHPPSELARNRVNVVFSLSGSDSTRRAE